MKITLSLNEIRAEAEKGIRGVGLSWGQAKDGGMIAAWLAGHDLPFMGTLNQCLDHADQPDTKNREEPDYIAIFDGMMLVEYVLATGTPWHGEVMMPRFLLAAMAIVGAEQGQCFTLKDGDGNLLAKVDHDQSWIAKDGVASGSYQIIISPDRSDDDSLDQCAWSDHIAHEVPQKCWHALGRYAARTYVPETEEKRRAGAGAGDIDNT